MTNSRWNDIEDLLHRLNSADAGPAWAAFIDRYSGLVMKAVVQFEFDQDRRNECFLYVCEKLCEDRFRRLLTFNTKGAASFPGWLSTVTLRLCIDWHRKEYGRARMIPAISALPSLDRRVYRHCYEESMGTSECYETLRADIPGLARSQITDALRRIHAVLTPRQRWQLNVRVSGRRRTASALSLTAPERIRDPDSTPEEQAQKDQQAEALRDAISRLAPDQRLLLLLRFREGLSYERIAQMERLGNAHRARRRVQSALEALSVQWHRFHREKIRQN